MPGPSFRERVREAAAAQHINQPGEGVGAALSNLWNNTRNPAWWNQVGGPALLKDMQTLPERAGSILMQPVNALDRFGRTLTGQEGGYGLEYDPSMGRVAPSQQLFDDANLLGGMAATGGMPIPKPTNSLGMFGGVMAKTADKAALKKAQDMAENGVSREAIWNETGWFKGTDGKWRFEIDDSKAPMLTRADEAGLTNSSIKQVIGHKQLFKAYPDTKDIFVTPTHDALGVHYGDINQIGIHPVDAGDFTPSAMKAVKSTTLHELQHALQKREGFARGGSPDDRELMFEVRRIREEAERTYSTLLEDFHTFMDGEYGPRPSPAVVRDAKLAWAKANPEKARMLSAAEKALDLRGAQSGYRILAGEVEARNVQKRMGMDAVARRATPPWLTQDVPDPLQIVRLSADRAAQRLET